MVHAGVIPFLHPSYDEQGHLPIPEFLRPKTPAEFKERMDRLLNNEQEYESVITGLRKLLCKPEYYDGTLWPGRFIAQATGIVTFAVLTFILLNEGLSTKTIVSLSLAILIIAIQLLWK